MTLPIAHFLAPDAPPGPAMGRCGVCGASGDGMYPRRDILDTTGSNITTLFPHNTATMCRHCVALWKVPKHWHRGIFATADATYFPLIAPLPTADAAWVEVCAAREDAKTKIKNMWALQVLAALGDIVSWEAFAPAYDAVLAPLRLERPLWRDLFATPERWQERPCVAVVTTDPKKRVWPHARVSQGPRLLLYIHDPSRGVSGNRWVAWRALSAVLALVEDAYALGAYKSQIATTLYTPVLLKAHGLATLQALETRLMLARSTPEFLPALIVAQKPGACG